MKKNLILDERSNVYLIFFIFFIFCIVFYYILWILEHLIPNMFFFCRKPNLIFLKILVNVHKCSVDLLAFILNTVRLLKIVTFFLVTFRRRTFFPLDIRNKLKPIEKSVACFMHLTIVWNIWYWIILTYNPHIFDVILFVENNIWFK